MDASSTGSAVGYAQEEEEDSHTQLEVEEDTHRVLARRHFAFSLFLLTEMN